MLNVWTENRQYFSVCQTLGESALDGISSFEIFGILFWKMR